MGVSLAVAAVILTPPAALSWPRSTPSTGAFAAVVVLGLVCTAAAFMILPGLIADAGPSRATVITYVNPLIAVILGVAVLSERPGAGALAGLVLILTGSWVATGGRVPAGWTRRRRAAAAEAEEPPPEAAHTGLKQP